MLVVAIDPVVPAGLAHAEVLVVAPALNSWLRRWLSDEDPARRRAEERVAACRRPSCNEPESTSEGRVGDADPLQAIADALPTFPADEIVIAAGSERSTQLVDDLVSRARERFALPIFRAGRRSRALRSARSMPEQAPDRESTEATDDRVSATWRRRSKLTRERHSVLEDKLRSRSRTTPFRWHAWNGRSPVLAARELNYSERNTMKNVIRFKESRSVRPARQGLGGRGRGRAGAPGP